MKKKIKVSKEDYEFLKECKNLLNTQDNRATANPIYCIQDVEKVYYVDGNEDGCIWVDKSEPENYFHSIEEIKERYESGCGEIDFDCEDEDNVTVNIDGMIDRFEKIGYVNQKVIKEGATFSFFEKDAKDHLKGNHYHYTGKAITYACSSWRSPLMNRLRKLLMELDI
jgi:hypothetical protein